MPIARNTYTAAAREPNDMIDLHCHFLPGVDDGAETLEEALTLARAAVANGIRHAVLTPHVHPGRYGNVLSTLRPHFLAYQRALDVNNIPLAVHLGGEIRLCPEALPLFDSSEVPWIGGWEGHRVVLLEFPPGQIPVGAIRLVAPLRARGIVPLLAHPERNKDVMRDWKRIGPFVKEGCLLQVTAGSLTGNFGTQAKQTADQLLEAGWVSVIATDAHNLEHRPPLLAQARVAVASRYGADAAALLTEFNPARIIVGGRSLAQSEPIADSRAA